MGASIDGIARNRDAYLDNYYRTANAQLSYNNELNTDSSYIESITNDLSGSGISSALSSFYDAAQSLSQNPTDATARNNFVQQATAVCDQFNQVSGQLTDFRTSLVGDATDPGSLSSSKISTAVSTLNNDLSSLAQLNKNINISTTQGQTPNSLLDQRDSLLDDMSNYIPISVTQEANNEVNVSINGVNLVSGSQQTGMFNVSANNSTDPALVSIQDMSGNTVVSDAKSMLTTGQIGGILDIAGSSSNSLSINGVLNNLNTLASSFAQQINTIQEKGQYIDATTTPGTNRLAQVTPPSSLPQYDIFTGDPAANTVTDYSTVTAANLQVSSAIQNDPNKVAAASTYAPGTPILTTDPNSLSTGDGSNALAMANIRNSVISFTDNSANPPTTVNSTMDQYLTSISGNIGVQTATIQNNYQSQNDVVSQITQRRDSEDGVDLDEELTNLVKYQSAYQASAKVFNAVNEMLQTIMSLGQ